MPIKRTADPKPTNSENYENEFILSIYTLIGSLRFQLSQKANLRDSKSLLNYMNKLGPIFRYFFSFLKSEKNLTFLFNENIKEKIEYYYSITKIEQRFEFVSPKERKKTSNSLTIRFETMNALFSFVEFYFPRTQNKIDQPVCWSFPTTQQHWNIKEERLLRLFDFFEGDFEFKFPEKDEQFLGKEEVDKSYEREEADPDEMAQRPFHKLRPTSLQAPKNTRKKILRNKSFITLKNSLKEIINSVGFSSQVAWAFRWYTTKEKKIEVDAAQGFEGEFIRNQDGESDQAYKEYIETYPFYSTADTSFPHFFTDLTFIRNQEYDAFCEYIHLLVSNPKNQPALARSLTKFQTAYKYPGVSDLLDRTLHVDVCDGVFFLGSDGVIFSPEFPSWFFDFHRSAGLHDIVNLYAENFLNKLKRSTTNRVETILEKSFTERFGLVKKKFFPSSLGLETFANIRGIFWREFEVVPCTLFGNSPAPLTPIEQYAYAKYTQWSRDFPVDAVPFIKKIVVFRYSGYLGVPRIDQVSSFPLHLKDIFSQPGQLSTHQPWLQSSRFQEKNQRFLTAQKTFLTDLQEQKVRSVSAKEYLNQVKERKAALFEAFQTTSVNLFRKQVLARARSPIFVRFPHQNMLQNLQDTVLLNTQTLSTCGRWVGFDDEESRRHFVYESQISQLWHLIIEDVMNSNNSVEFDRLKARFEIELKRKREEPPKAETSDIGVLLKMKSCIRKHSKDKNKQRQLELCERLIASQTRARNTSEQLTIQDILAILKSYMT